MKLYHNNEFVGEIVTNHSMTIDEACELLNIDINETEPSGDRVWDYELFRMEY